MDPRGGARQRGDGCKSAHIGKVEEGLCVSGVVAQCDLRQADVDRVWHERFARAPRGCHGRLL